MNAEMTLCYINDLAKLGHKYPDRSRQILSLIAQEFNTTNDVKPSPGNISKAQIYCRLYDMPVESFTITEEELKMLNNVDRSRSISGPYYPQKIECIKSFRARWNLGLLETKNLFEYLQGRNYIEPQTVKTFLLNQLR